MIPIRDTNPTRVFSYITTIIIILNVYVFILQLSLDKEDEDIFYFNHAVIPKCFIASMLGAESYEKAVEETKRALIRAKIETRAIRNRGWTSEREIREIRDIVDEKFHRQAFGINGRFAEIISLFSSMFIHGGLWHLIGNMWFLWIFGNNIEDALGAVKFIFFYVICGVGAAFGHIIFSINSVIPTIGASGAISGVLGAYLLMYPHARILTFIPIGWFLWMEDLPAYLFLGYWIIIQVVAATFSNPLLNKGGGVAWFAHIVGFFCGILFVILFERRKAALLGINKGEAAINIIEEDDEDELDRQ